MAPVTNLPDEQMAEQDIGLLNMQSALGLPGTDYLTTELIESYVAKLDDWAEQIHQFTEQRQALFARRPSEYDNSLAQFRILCLATYLYKNLGVRYNHAFMQGEYDATDSRNLFIHGLLSGHGGTCATMPVLYIALGRRLGYPLKLVPAKEHFFVRWDEPGGERFNIEATSAGFTPRPDSHYRQWPIPISDKEMKRGYYLRSLQPREELVHSLDGRIACLIEHLKFGDALLACFLTARLAPELPGVQERWAWITIMARALEQARQQAGVRDYNGLDLRKVHVPETKPPIRPMIAEVARETLQRIAGNREKHRDATFTPTAPPVPPAALA